MTAQLDVVPAQVESHQAEAEKTASGLHGVIASRINGYIFMYLQQNRCGHVLDSSVTYNFNDDEPKREPDVSFVSLDKMAVPPDEELTVVPDLAIEVVSRNDKAYEIEAKIRQYQQAGVTLVWVMYPLSQKVKSTVVLQVLSRK